MPSWWPGILSFLLLAGCVHAPPPSNWTIEAEDPAARVVFGNGTIEIDTPGGLTLWHPRRLSGAVRIAFDAMAVSAGGRNDRVSDLNAFWMASERGAAVFPRRRSGRFEDYDTLTTYYVGIGGNGNTTTRLRRYTGIPGDRPLLPQHDLSATADLLQPNRWTRIVLIADGAHIAVERDGRRVFAMVDPAPYRGGWFALRTTQSHLKIRNLHITP